MHGRTCKLVLTTATGIKWAPCSADWNEKLTGFDRLILVKVFRQEKLTSGMAQYVGELHGRNFQFPPPWRLEEIFPDTVAQTPIVFVLSTGADPTTLLQRFAETMGMTPGERLHMISLGQGQVCSPSWQVGAMQSCNETPIQITQAVLLLKPYAKQEVYSMNDGWCRVQSLKT